jgi:Ca2+-binding RTX toxin-like protein
MASIPGSHYDIFAPNQPVNMALTYDANSAAPPVSGEFNLEVVINSTGTGDYPIAQGYQGVLIETPPGKGSPATLTMLHGNYGLVDGAGNDRIFLGDGSESIGGALGDTLASGTGLNQFLDGHLGNQSILGGTAGTETIWGGPGDTIRGGSGGNEFIAGDRGNQSIVGGSGGNETIWGGAGDTIQGGSGGNETIAGVSGETITGGAANTLFDVTAGNESIVAGSGNSTIWGGAHDTVRGASGSGSALIGFAGGNETLWDNGSTATGHDSVSTFSQAGGDRVSLNAATDTIANVVGTASTSGGNTTVTLHDGSTITFIGISSINNTFFTTH